VVSYLCGKKNASLLPASGLYFFNHRDKKPQRKKEREREREREGKG